MDIERLCDKIIQCRETTSGDRACLVGISGIDASGKGHIAGKLGKNSDRPAIALL